MSSDSKLRRDLFQSLEDVGRIGDEHHAAFATQGVLPEAINPGLSIKGLGTIGLPLSTRDEAGLIKVCHQAPFGKGSETFVDTNVRNTLEVNADQLELRNPAWPKALAGVLQDVSNSMGIVGGATSIKAELYRLLLYKEGAFFDKHTESVLIIDHEKQQLTGIKHQKDTGYARSVPMLGPWRKWFHSTEDDSDDPGDIAIYVLRHKYTDASLRTDHLKGTDRARAQCLEAACKAHNFVFFLANMETSRHGGCDEDDMGYYTRQGGQYHKLDEIYNEDYALQALFYSNGTKVATDVKVGKSDFLQDELFLKTPDEEDYSGWTGNEGVSATHYYRRSCLVVMPKEYEGRFLRDAAGKGKVDTGTWLGKDLDRFRQNPADLTLRGELRATCDSIIDASKAHALAKAAVDAKDSRYAKMLMARTHTYPDHVIGCVAEAVLLMEDPALFEDAAPRVQDTLPSEVFHELGKKLTGKSRESWRASYVLWLLFIAKATRRLHHLHAAFEHISEGFRGKSEQNDAIVAEMTELEREALESAFASDISVVKQDAQTLADLASKYGEAFLCNSIIPFVKKQVSNSTFAICFLTRIYNTSKFGTDGTIQKESVQATYKQLLKDVTVSFTFEFHEPPCRYTSWSYYSRSSPTPEPPKADLMTGAELSEFMSTVLQLELHDDFSKLVQTITTASKNIDMAACDILIWPFLKALRDLCKRTDSVSNNHMDMYGLLFQGILAAYITRFVRQEPARPTDWKFPRKGCSKPSCTDCQTLDRFLTHPSQQTERFKTNQDRRKHISNQISSYSEPGLSKSTDKSNSPHTLVVTKTDQKWRDEHGQWEFRCTEAGNKMRALEPELRGLLGGRYEEIKGLGGVKLPEKGGGQKGMRDKGREPLASVQQPGKRKAEEGDDDGAGARKKMKGFENLGGAEVVDLT
ncbi:MAG: hypothetical protein LQ350_000891 [Teloschistes chrysophthalmus]|nr:MAG: hypothetical protein LQ350_000891 [Niorma chrysophthalma]